MAAEPADSTSWRNYKLQEVDVYGKRHDFGVLSSQMSAISITGAEIKATPVVMGEVDVLKSLQALPGVQQGSDGKTALFVRGGNFDQNLMLVDGIPLYNSDHLGGYLSAINPDLVGDVAMYKGAFPARYGARLSSVIDVSMREGDMHNYHAALTLGMITSHLQVEGPILNGRTSFNFGARASYFDAIIKPIYEKVSDKPESMRPFNKMDYYDLSAKIVHRFSPESKLSAFAYYGHDVYDSAPSGTATLVTSRSADLYKGEYIPYLYKDKIEKENSTSNSWSNVLAGVEWQGRLSRYISLDVAARISSMRYKYMQTNYEDILSNSYRGQTQNELTIYSPVYEMEKHSSNNSSALYHSDVDDYSITAAFSYLPKNRKHDIRWGVTGSWQRVNPSVDVLKNKVITHDTDSTDMVATHINADTIVGNKLNVKNVAIYAEDDWAITKALSASVGLRYSLSAVSGKTYDEIEPRVSLRYLLPGDRVSVKASYTRMSQALRILTSSNLITNSDMWVAATEDIPLMTSNQYAAAVNYEIFSGLDLAVEGYYKTMDNLLEYRDGSSYMTTKTGWESMVVQGKGRAYGVELFLQKKVGRITGHASYTWSKSLRTFDRRGQEVNAGREYYAPNDRRHSANLTVGYKINSHWAVTASWSYMTGRRGTLSDLTYFGGFQSEYDSFGSYFSSNASYLFPNVGPNNPDGISYFEKYLRYTTFKEKNGYVLPATHHLDLSANYTLKHKRLTHAVNISIYNVYNHGNVSRVYLGYDNDGNRIIKGVCNFPIMPSINYTLSF